MIEPERLLTLDKAPVNFIAGASGMIIGNHQELVKEIYRLQDASAEKDKEIAELKAKKFALGISRDFYKDEAKEYDEKIHEIRALVNAKSEDVIHDITKLQFELSALKESANGLVEEHIETVTNCDEELDYILSGFPNEAIKVSPNLQALDTFHAQIKNQLQRMKVAYNAKIGVKE